MATIIVTSHDHDRGFSLGGPNGHGHEDHDSPGVHVRERPCRSCDDVRGHVYVSQVDAADY